MTRFLVLALAVFVATLPTLAADDARAKAAAAMAITEPIPKPIAKPTAVKTPCKCSDTGECKCEKGECECCKSGVPDYAVQIEKAKKNGQILVLFAGCKGSCLDGALAATNPAAKPVVSVGYVKVHASGDVRVLVAKELPPTADKETIEEAIASAKWCRDHGKWEFVKDNPFCHLNCTGHYEWYPENPPAIKRASAEPGQDLRKALYADIDNLLSMRSWMVSDGQKMRLRACRAAIGDDGVLAKIASFLN